MDALEKMLLEQVADLHKVPDGAYNIRANGGAGGRRSTETVKIENRTDGKQGIDIFVASETQGESVHIPVVITKEGYGETVYNDFYVGAGADVVSRSVAAGSSVQEFVSHIVGKAKCHGHTECDAIIMENAKVTATPCLSAECIDAELIHEAAIGKIAGEQLTKLMTLGLDEKQAEEQIIKGFLS